MEACVRGKRCKIFVCEFRRVLQSATSVLRIALRCNSHITRRALVRAYISAVCPMDQ